VVVPTGTSIAPTPKFNATNTGSCINLQVGIQGNKHSQINFGTGFRLNLPDEDFDVTSDEALNTVDNFIATLNEKQTELGAVTNRLESALDEITIQYENLASSRSTIRDADMAELSSTYIQQQILQEASATLLATTKNIQYQNVLGLLQGLRG
jgi:flagellin